MYETKTAYHSDGIPRAYSNFGTIKIVLSGFEAKNVNQEKCLSLVLRLLS